MTLRSFRFSAGFNAYGAYGDIQLGSSGLLYPKQRYRDGFAIHRDLNFCAAFRANHDALGAGCGFADQMPAVTAMGHQHIVIHRHSPRPHASWPEFQPAETHSRS